jgi:hypothetical protein
MKKLRLTDNAIKNHEELFPNHESKLQKTDPRLSARLQRGTPKQGHQFALGGSVDHYTRDTLRERARPTEGDLWGNDRQDAPAVSQGPDAHPGLSRGELFWRLLHPQRPGYQNERQPMVTPHGKFVGRSTTKKLQF